MLNLSKHEDFYPGSTGISYFKHLTQIVFKKIKFDIDINIMEKFSKLLFRLLTNSFAVSTLFLIVAILNNETSLQRGLFGIIGFYGTLITMWLALLPIISRVIVYIKKAN